MDFFHFATTNARYEFQPKESADQRQQIRELNDQIVTRYLRRLGTDADLFKVTPVGGGEGEKK